MLSMNLSTNLELHFLTNTVTHNPSQRRWSILGAKGGDFKEQGFSEVPKAPWKRLFHWQHLVDGPETIGLQLVQVHPRSSQNALSISPIPANGISASGMLTVRQRFQ